MPVSQTGYVYPYQLADKVGAMMTRRLLQLFTGLAMYGVSLAMFIRAGLGLDPWDVFDLDVDRLASVAALPDYLEGRRLSALAPASS